MRLRHFDSRRADMALVVKSGADKRTAEPEAAASRHWTFLSNHGHVLVCLAQNPDARLRDVAQAVGITERAVQKIVSDLEEAGVVIREREGRRNRYSLHTDRPLRHPIEAHRTVGALLAMVLDRAEMRRITSQGGEGR
jgi:DNA-binding transcriptional ArsR family regulator